MSKLILILIIFSLSACSIGPHYYKGKYNLNADKISKNELSKELIKIANNNEFHLSKNVNDTLEFQGPPYHLIEFVFSENTNSDSLSFQFNYNGLLSTSSRANELHARLQNAIDSTFKGKITYTPIK